jgi:hypothetical protein
MLQPDSTFWKSDLTIYKVSYTKSILSMKKLIKSIKKELHSNVHGGHLFLFILVPLLIYVGVHWYAQAMSSELIVNKPVHTRIVYYDGQFSQDIATEEIDTSVYVVNTTSEYLNVAGYEYDQTGKNLLTNAVVEPNKQAMFTVITPGLVSIQNQNKDKSSVVLVGKNKAIDYTRFELIQNNLLKTIAPNNSNTAQQAVLQLMRLRKFDSTINQNCQSLYTIVSARTLQLFTKNDFLQAVESTCGVDNPVATKESHWKDAVRGVAVRKGNVLELTLPDNF